MIINADNYSDTRIVIHNPSLDDLSRQTDIRDRLLAGESVVSSTNNPLIDGARSSKLINRSGLLQQTSDNSNNFGIMPMAECFWCEDTCDTACDGFLQTVLPGKLLRILYWFMFW